jgi:hypothetical protein
VKLRVTKGASIRSFTHPFQHIRHLLPAYVFLNVKISPHPRWLLTGVIWWKNGYAYGGRRKKEYEKG